MSTTTPSTTVRPYKWWWHPHKSLIDIILGFLLHCLFPFPKFQKQPEHDLETSHIQHAQKVRTMLTKFNENHRGFAKWSQNLGGIDICMTTVHISRNDRIFSEWNICDQKKKWCDIPGDAADIPIQLAFPVSLLPDTVAIPTERNGYGCLEWNGQTPQAILDWLPKHVPVVVFCHGGAMTIGSVLMTEALDLLNHTKVNRPYIYMSVDYSQAPEAQFPTAPCEVLSVTQYLLERFDNVHISGASAGGYLALVATLEACRAQNFPRQDGLKSMLSMIPMTDPSTSSRSYIENSTSSHFVPSHLLHWSYQVYLGMPDVESEPGNQLAWDECRWKSSPLRRLVEPLYDVPKLVTTHTKLIILTNRADPLHDDGQRMVELLRQKGNVVQHFDVRGSHWFGLLFDSVAYNKLATTWKDTIFGSEGLDS